MVTLLTKYKPIEIPVDGQPPYLVPLVIARDDLTSQRAWGKLEDDHDAFLEVGDFEDIDLFEKYWLVSLGLLEFPHMMFIGDKGGGKSLLLNYILHKISKHFGKKSVINWAAKNPKALSPFNNESDPDKAYLTLLDDKVVDILQDEINEFNHKMMVEKRKPKVGELEKLSIFNTHIGIDEASGVAGKIRTNQRELLVMLVDRIRHFYTGIMLSYVDPGDATPRLGIDYATHVVTCSKNKYYIGACSYRIYSKRQGVAKMLHLKPEDWTNIWDSHNPVAVNFAANIKFGNEKAKDIEKKRKIKGIREELNGMGIANDELIAQFLNKDIKKLINAIKDRSN
jgi:hypothetical protein